MTHTKNEALKLALEALDSLLYWDNGKPEYDEARETITAIKQALAAPTVQDSTCNETLRAQGKAYPRTCKKCGLGPCIGALKQPPAQPAPVPLTDEKISAIGSKIFPSTWNPRHVEFARAIEAAHGITKGQP